MLLPNYTRRNNIAKKLIFGGLVVATIALMGTCELMISRSNIKNNLKLLPKHNVADIRQSYEQDLKSNKNFNYVVAGIGVLGMGISAIGKRLYRRD